MIRQLIKIKDLQLNQKWSNLVFQLTLLDDSSHQRPKDIFLDMRRGPECLCEIIIWLLQMEETQEIKRIHGTFTDSCSSSTHHQASCSEKEAFDISKTKAVGMTKKTARRRRGEQQQYRPNQHVRAALRKQKLIEKTKNNSSYEKSSHRLPNSYSATGFIEISSPSQNRGIKKSRQPRATDGKERKNLKIQNLEKALTVLTGVVSHFESIFQRQARIIESLPPLCYESLIKPDSSLMNNFSSILNLITPTLSKIQAQQIHPSSKQNATLCRTQTELFNPVLSREQNSISSCMSPIHTQSTRKYSTQLNKGEEKSFRANQDENMAPGDQIRSQEDLFIDSILVGRCQVQGSPE